LVSALCTEAQLTSPSFAAWAEVLRPAWDPAGTGRPAPLHRKVWEWVFIAEALRERGMLRPGRRGLGFGVGTEPLVALFASYGCEIVATDLDDVRAIEVGWSATGQHAADLADLNRLGLCPQPQFERQVTFQVVDMNEVPADLEGFDFCWSSCALEHLGTIGAGQEFVFASMRTLRPGGVAVHTTEFNVSSNEETVDGNGTVLFRRRDIEETATRLRLQGHKVSVDFDAGEGLADDHVDVPPYSDTHLKIELAQFVSTSIGLIVETRPSRIARAVASRWARARARHA
jgi:2-polyprenyl-3-methyl-5-hydroxy-6-metoxy-1,4-benzoquinol methylase